MTAKTLRKSPRLCQVMPYSCEPAAAVQGGRIAKKQRLGH